MSGTTEEHSAAVGQVGEDMSFIVTLTGHDSIAVHILAIATHKPYSYVIFTCSFSKPCHVQMSKLSNFNF